MAFRFINNRFHTNFSRGDFVGVIRHNGLFLGYVTSSSGDNYLHIKLTNGQHVKTEVKNVQQIKDFSLSQLKGNALKRCPFCHRKPIRTRIRDGGMTFRCSNSKCIIYDDHQGFDNLEKAIEPWNRRE